MDLITYKLRQNGLGCLVKFYGSNVFVSVNTRDISLVYTFFHTIKRVLFSSYLVPIKLCHFYTKTNQRLWMNVIHRKWSIRNQKHDWIILNYNKTNNEWLWTQSWIQWRSSAFILGIRIEREDKKNSIKTVTQQLVSYLEINGYNIKMKM